MCGLTGVFPAKFSSLFLAPVGAASQAGSASTVAGLDSRGRDLPARTMRIVDNCGRIRLLNTPRIDAIAAKNKLKISCEPEPDRFEFTAT
jgi:hypothetical protein